MSVNDRRCNCGRTSSFIASTLLCVLGASGIACAAPEHAPPPAAAPAATAAPAQPGADTSAADQSGAASSVPGATDVRSNEVVLSVDGSPASYATSAPTVGAFLRERGLPESANAFVAPERDAALTDGMQITYRSAVPVVLYVGKRKRRVESSALTVADLLEQQNVALAARDNVRPALATALVAGEIVQVTHRRAWTAHLRTRLAPKTKARTDPSLPLGMIKTLKAGRAGYRETTVRVVKSDTGLVTRTVLASRIVRPRPRIIVRGLAVYTSLAHVAAAGFKSVLHFAGSALHVIATAYSAQCDGCSGTTASGAHAGFGIVAVDPSVIPLGTQLFVPGYGRAVAGDTGGAIIGHRVDLGFDSTADAMRFGEHALTIYVLKR